MKLLVASPRGFCAGVWRAIEIVNLALNKFGPPIYVRKEIVHNKMVVEDFKQRGVVFIDELSEAPIGSNVIFSAHGISPSVRNEAVERKLNTIDATCPLVTKVHHEVHRFLRDSFKLILIGHKDHDEVIGTMGEAPGQITLVENLDQAHTLSFEKNEKIMVLTQTTLSADETKGMLEAIRTHYPQAQTPAKDDICYATQNRQDAVKDLIQKKIEVLLVVGSKNSSNSQRLCDVARESGAKAFLIDQATEIEPRWFQDVSVVGLTAGASAPEFLVQNVLSFLKENFQAAPEEVFVREENVSFSLPKELAKEKETTTR